MNIFTKHICGTCPFLAQCTESKDHQKIVTCLTWQEYVEEADHLRHKAKVKKIMENVKKPSNGRRRRKEEHGM